LLAGTGILVGLGIALIAAPAVTSLLYHVHPLDFPVFLAVPSILLAVAFVASLVPALRASRVEPMNSLRQG